MLGRRAFDQMFPLVHAILSTRCHSTANLPSAAGKSSVLDGSCISSGSRGACDQIHMSGLDHDNVNAQQLLCQLRDALGDEFCWALQQPPLYLDWTEHYSQQQHL